MHLIANCFPSPSSLRTTATVEKRDHDLLKERELYDYQRYDCIHQVVTNKDPLPRIERPCFGWIVRAAHAYAAAKIGLLKSGDRLEALKNGVKEPPPRTIRDRMKETSEVVGTVVTATRRVKKGNVDKAASSVGHQIIRAAKHTGSVASEMLSDPVALERIAPGDWSGGVDEKVEQYTTRDYRAYVGLNRLTPQEAAYFEHFDSDHVFARARVAGLNPMTIRRVQTEDMQHQGWKPTDLHLKDADECLQDDTLQQAHQDSRLYMVDFKWLEDAPDAADGSRFVFIPKALFAIPADAQARIRKPLIPVAIWVYRKGTSETEARVYTRHDGFSWQIAKLIISVLDGNDHEYYRHLFCTHLLMEPFGISLKRNMHHTHPIHRLLKPHFHGTILINNQALKVLIAKDGPVDKNLISPILDIAPLLGRQMDSMHFNDLFLKADLERRGVMDERLEYPYRDDAIALWDAIHKWVSSYAAEFYASDAAVVNDQELQAFASEVAGPKVGMKSFGDLEYLTGRSQTVISTRSYLVDALTMIVFTSSCQHAAMNFVQKPFLSYAPAWPLCLVQPELPANGQDSSVVSWADWKKWFPSMEQAGEQWFTNQLLGSVLYSRLGEYPSEVSKGSTGIARHLKDFQNELSTIGKRIEQRERENTRENGKTGVQYFVLHPKNIPASINI